MLRLRKIRFKRHTAKLLSIGFVLLIVLAQSKGWINITEVTDKYQPGDYKVVRYVDGDTITVDMDGKWETIRMIGVDTPETHKPDTPVQCFGVAASAYTHNLINDQRVRLSADPKNQNRDRYGRLLRYIYLPDGRLVAAELIRSGYGFAYTRFPFTKKDEFIRYEKEAKEQAKGLWEKCDVTEKDGLKQTNSLPPPTNEVAP